MKSNVKSWAVLRLRMLQYRAPENHRSLHPSPSSWPPPSPCPPHTSTVGTHTDYSGQAEPARGTAGNHQGLRHLNGKGRAFCLCQGQGDGLAFMSCLHHMPCVRPSFTQHNSGKEEELVPFYWHWEAKGLGLTNLVQRPASGVCCLGLDVCRAGQGTGS